ncbi:MAG TPA: NADH-quinone oxidoreductase subunit M [Verrucomicrobiae bacterium]|nr:NADH-quinone oxidoreductase subunit M [Verrucomicrobiae bacterium]
MTGMPLLTLLTLLPLVGGVLVMAIGSENRKAARPFSIGISAAVLAFTLLLLSAFNSESGAFQFEEKHLWIPTLGIEYRLAVDGLGMMMLLLTSIVTLMSMVASRGVTDRPQLYFGLLLFLQAGLIGTFTALNFFHWFVFWELSLIPAFFLVRLWGGSQRVAAAAQFFVYTIVGSIGLLLAFLALFLGTGHVSDFTALAALARSGELLPSVAASLNWAGLDAGTVAALIFAGALLGFAVKVPLMPFHTWLPATYSEAPSPITMLLTGVMSKMGMYGFLRILLPIFPQQLEQWRTPLLVLAVITIVFSASAAFVQRDIKRMLAYSSINHLGYCMLAVFAVATAGSGVPHPPLQKAAALNGALLQIFNHGLTAAALFWFVSLIEQRSGGVRGVDDFGGLRKVAPVFCGLMGIALFSSVGLPGLNGFVGEFLIFKGVFPLAMCSAAFAVIGLLATAIFILTLLQRVFNGPLNARWSSFPDLTTRERVLLAVPTGLMFVLGIYPQLLLGMFNSTVVRIVNELPF